MYVTMVLYIETALNVANVHCLLKCHAVKRTFCGKWNGQYVEW